MKKFIGDRAFYKTVFLITFPIMIQQGITTVVGLLDNVMVGQLNVNAIAGVSIANQILFVVMICFMGGLAGPGIFVAQYFGAKDDEGLRQSFRTKLLLAIFIGVIAFLVLWFYGEFFIKQFAKNDDPNDGIYNLEAIAYGLTYMRMILLALPFIAIIQLFASTFREMRQTKIPMYAGIASVFINLILNYLLIFGNFGFPRLEVYGAALATFYARLIEAGILVFIAFYYRFTFTHKLFKGFYIAKSLFIKILRKTVPLLTNELLWSMGTTFIMLAYAQRGTSVVAAFQISNTVANLFYIIFGALASGIAVMVGNELGSNRIEEAKANAWKLLFFAVTVCLVFGLVLASIAPFAPYLFKVDGSVRFQATQFMWVIAAAMWMFAFNAGCFFTLRAGGSVMITFVFDALFMWVFQVPAAILLTLYTGVPIIWVYVLVQSADLLKASVGFYLIKSGRWANNLTHHEVTL